MLLSNYIREVASWLLVFGVNLVELLSK